MKLKRNTLLTLLATVSITLASMGCGSAEDGNPNGTGVAGGAIYSANGVQNLGNGTYNITFNGTGAYDSGVMIQGTNYPTSANGAGTLTLGTPILPIGQVGTLVGQSMIYPGTTLQISKQSTGAMFQANISGVLSLSPQFTQLWGQLHNSTVQYLYLQAYPQGGSNMAFKVSFCCTQNPYTGQLQWATAE